MSFPTGGRGLYDWSAHAWQWALAAFMALYVALTVMRQVSKIQFMTVRGRNSRFGIWWRGQLFWHRIPAPSLTFFSHPPPYDLRVFARTCTLEDAYSSWQPVAYRHPGAIRFLWNPDRKRQKVVLEAASQLLREVQATLSLGQDQFVSGSTYRLLLASTSGITVGTKTSRQFLICKVFLAEEKSPEVLFVSRLESLEQA